MSVAKIAAQGEAPDAARLGEDFPIICEKCLGPNPYVRMIKMDGGLECRISGAPFTGFRWQGSLKRWKQTIICSSVAQEKNCCQSCLADLEYGVPFNVRDHVMDALGAESAPKSDVAKEYFWANKKQRQLDDATGGDGGFDSYDKLTSNLDRLKDLAAIDTKPVTWEKRDCPFTPAEREAHRQKRLNERRPPADATITSLYVAGCPPQAAKKDILPYFLAYGDVREIVLDTQRCAAVITYRERADAERAIGALHGNLVLQGSRVRVMWGKRKGGGGGGSSSAAASTAHDHYGEHAAPPPVPPPPKRRLPPGVKLPPGMAEAMYPSLNPDAKGVRPDKD